MNEQLASMIVRSEHTQRQISQSHTPILDFDRRGYAYTPGWFEQGLGKLQRLMSSLIAVLKDRRPVHHEPTITHETPISENY